MRKAFAHMVASLHNREDCFFLTGDLGFMALEGIREAFGSRFINAGVAEQNMVGVAAGLAREGFSAFVYSIAPFCYARPFEQIRNDLCPGRLAVCLVGNGGGYAYGHMGPTHHALEDCAAMNALGVKVIVPSFDDDLAEALPEISRPVYLRLGVDERPAGMAVPGYAPWRQLLAGERGTMAALGPLAGVAWQALLDLPIAQRPSLWAVTEFDIQAIPDQFFREATGKPLFVIEEHVAAGGLGMLIALALVGKTIAVSRFAHRCAQGYPSGRFGSQAFHRGQCDMDYEGIRRLLAEVGP
jgi:transketolase